VSFLQFGHVVVGVLITLIFSKKKAIEMKIRNSLARVQARESLSYSISIARLLRINYFVFIVHAF